MNFISSLVIILILAGLFVLMYVIGSVTEALERYLAGRRGKRKNSTLTNGKERV